MLTQHSAMCSWLHCWRWSHRLQLRHIFARLQDNNRLSRMSVDNYKVESMVRGYHVYHDIWEATVGETLLCQWETGNPHDPYAISVETGNSHDPYAVSVIEGSTVVGHLPWAISAVCSLLLTRNGTISCKVTSTRHKSSDLPQGGLEIPCKLIFAGVSRDISEVQKLITVAQSSGLGMTCKKDDDAEPEKKEGEKHRVGKSSQRRSK